ncbi:MAG: diguanylate cyclase [Fervidobacterium sp.]
MNKKELLFFLTCIFASVVFLSLSQPLIVSTDLPLMLLSLALLLFSQSVNIEIGGVVLNLKSFAVLYLLMFLNPESIIVLIMFSLLVYIKRFQTFLFKLSFEILQISFATFLLKLAPHDYFRLPYFAFGYLLTNVILLSFYVKIFAKSDLRLYIRPMVTVFVLTLYGATLLTTLYFFSNVTLASVLFVTLLYSGFVGMLYYSVKANLWYEELRLEKEQISREVQNLMKITEALDSTENDVDKVIEKILAISCEITGFEYALLSLFDFRSGKVVRIARYGLSDEAFERLKASRPDIKSTYVLMQQRFDINGAYFIPSGSVDLNQSYVYQPESYLRLEITNAWDPNDLFLVPLVYKNKRIGYISYDKPYNMMRPSKREVEFAKFFAWQITRILLDSKYSVFFLSEYKKEENYSFLMEEVSKYIETGKSFTIVYMDIDKFEKLNFALGFTVGDEILKELKSIVDEEIKNFGIFTQVGDETIIVLLGMGKSDATLLAQRIIEKLKERFPSISVSTAIVKYPADASSFDEVLEKCKMALTTSKKSGGGRIISL